VGSHIAGNRSQANEQHHINISKGKTAGHWFLEVAQPVFILGFLLWRGIGVTTEKYTILSCPPQLELNKKRGHYHAQCLFYGC